MQAIQEELRAYIVENYFFGQDERGLKDEDSFLELGIIDSTGVLELVSHLEDKYAIEITSDELIPENLDSIARLATFVASKRTRVDAGLLTDDRHQLLTSSGGNA